VAFDKPDQQRVTVLWNADGAPLRVRVARHGTTAQVYQLDGSSSAPEAGPGGYTLLLPAATAYFEASATQRDPEGYHYIGGAPLFLVESRVDAAAPVAPPKLA
jgi:hypothetical protein